MRYFLFLSSLIVGICLGHDSSFAQPTVANTKVVYSTNGAFLTQTITDPAIEFVVFEIIVAPRSADPGFISQSAEIKLRGPVGTQATLEMEKVFPNVGAGVPYPLTFADGARSIQIKPGNAYEEYVRYLQLIYPGITLEQLRQMYSPDELERMVEVFWNSNQRTILDEGIVETAILQKDTCSPNLRTYRARLIVDLRGVSAEDRTPPFKVAGAIKTLDPDVNRAALIKTGDATDGALKGKRVAFLASPEPSMSKIQFVTYTSNRRLRILKAKKTSVTSSPYHGSLLKSEIPKIRKIKKVTIEQIGRNGQSVYSVCAPLVSKKPVRLNGFKTK